MASTSQMMFSSVRIGGSYVYPAALPRALHADPPRLTRQPGGHGGGGRDAGDISPQFDQPPFDRGSIGRSRGSRGATRRRLAASCRRSGLGSRGDRTSRRRRDASSPSTAASMPLATTSLDDRPSHGGGSGVRPRARCSAIRGGSALGLGPDAPRRNGRHSHEQPPPKGIASIARRPDCRRTRPTLTASPVHEPPRPVSTSPRSSMTRPWPRAVRPGAARALLDADALEADLYRSPGRATVRVRPFVAARDRPDATRRWRSASSPSRRATGLPRPEVNVWIAPPAATQADFLWRDHRLIVETDGRADHDGDWSFERDRHRDAAWLRPASGWSASPGAG